MPSGIWEAEEYAKLPGYDGDTSLQVLVPFACHQQDGHLCSGWLACHTPDELLAVRLGVIRGTISPEVMGYTTTVPVFQSGSEAAAHGLKQIDTPSERAQNTIAKILKRRDAR